MFFLLSVKKILSTKLFFFIAPSSLKKRFFSFSWISLLQFLFQGQKNTPLMAMEPTSRKAIHLILGWILLILGLSMAIPLGIAYVYKETSFEAFFLGGFLSIFLGGVFILSSVGQFKTSHFFLEKKFHLSLSDGFLLTFLCWVFISLGSCVPFYGSSLFLQKDRGKKFFLSFENQKTSCVVKNPLEKNFFNKKSWKKKDFLFPSPDDHNLSKNNPSKNNPPNNNTISSYHLNSPSPSPSFTPSIPSLAFSPQGVVHYVLHQPTLYHEVGTSFSGALFEAVSSLTTTGVTLVEEQHLLHKMDKSLQFWRLFLQFLGGFGIVLMAITLLPGLKIGGSQLAMTEFSDFWEKQTPRNIDIARDLFFLYCGATLLGSLGLFIQGLHFLDALSYSISSISTGGIALPHIPLRSLSLWSKSILIALMILGGTTFSLVIGHFRGHKKIWKDDQWRVYSRLLFFSSLITVFYLCSMGSSKNTLCWTLTTSLEERIVNGFFMATSALTGVGFNLYSPYDSFLGLFFFLLSLIGGCSGSISGGIKIFRFYIVYKMAKNHLLSIMYPYGVFLTSYNTKEVTYKNLTSIVTIIFFYIGGWLLFSLGFAFFQRHLLESLSLSGSLITNSGLSFGNNGAHGHLTLSTLERYWSILAMVCGRFEFLTFLVFIGKITMKK